MMMEAKYSEKFLIFCFWIVPHFDVANHVPIVTSPIMHFCPRIVAIEAVTMPIKGPVDTMRIHNTILAVSHVPFYMGQRSKVLTYREKKTAS